MVLEETHSHRMVDRRGVHGEKRRVDDMDKVEMVGRDEKTIHAILL